MQRRYNLGPSQDYKLVEYISADGFVPVHYFINTVNGIKIFLSQVDCPLVNGNLVFATECHDDYGLPHTLEHLVFLGTEDYPFKGTLDLFANKSYADGTNASTDVDNTDYEFQTAGSEGFLYLLPIYLDHLFFPLLRDEAFITEIYHINDRGEDAGVVYSEMQARQNTSDDICQLELSREMYPGDCGYRYCYGGLVEKLRELDNEKIRNYHKAYYVPENLCIIVTGPITPEALFASIKPIEDKLYEVFAKQELMRKRIERPWQSEVPPLEKNVVKTIQFPSETKSDASVYLGFRGPNSVNNYQDIVAISLLLEYLNQQTVSPFQREFIERDEPYCSFIDGYIIENRESYFYFVFESVIPNLMEKILPKALTLLWDIFRGEEDFDLNRMNIIISRQRVSILLNSEKNPHDVVLNAAKSQFLYGDDDLRARFQTLSYLDKFSKKDKDFWIQLIYKYMVGPNSRYVCINGQPSIELLESINQEEEFRLAQRKIDYDDDFDEFKDKLNEALDIISRNVPQEIIDKVPTPSIDSIKFHNIESHELEHDSLPIRIRYDHIKTNFVSIFLGIDTSKTLNGKQRFYLPLLEQLLFESPIMKNGTLIPHQQVIMQLFADTINVDISTGVSGTMSNILSIRFQIEVEKYTKAVEWISDILFNSQFTEERVRHIATRMLGDLLPLRRDGSKICGASAINMLYKSDTNLVTGNFLKQSIFLKSLLKVLKTDPSHVISELYQVRKNLTEHPKNMYVHLALDKTAFGSIDNIMKPWLNLLPEHINLQTNPRVLFDPQNIVHDRELTNVEKQVAEGFAIPNGSIESNYLKIIVPSITDPFDPDLAALLVIIEYFNQTEGPLYRKLRGEGLTYSYNISQNTFAGIMSFGLYQSTQPSDAMIASSETILNVPSLEQKFIQSAKSSLIYSCIKTEKNPISKSMQVLRSFLLQIPADYERQLINMITQAKTEDLVRVGIHHLTNVFLGFTRRTSICGTPIRMSETIDSMNRMGFNLKQISLNDPKLIDISLA